MDRDAGGHARRGERGAVIPFVALMMVVLVGFTAIAIDTGRHRVSHRDMQAVADVVSLDLARRLDGSTVAELMAPGSDFRNEVGLSSERNGYDLPLSDVELGTVADTTFDFVALTAPTDVPDAVRVTAREVVEYLFRPGSGSTTRRAVAVAAEEDGAYFKVGSFLVGVDPNADSFVGQIINSVIPGASALSWSGLADADVTLEQLGLHMPFGALSPEQALDTTISYEDMTLAFIGALQAEGGNTAAIAVLDDFLVMTTTVEQVRLGDVLGIDGSGGTPAGSVNLDVLQVLTSSVFLIDGTHSISVPGTSLGIPGVGDVVVSLEVIEIPQIGGPEDGATASTGQFELTVTPTLHIGTSQSRDLCTLPSGEQNLLNSLVGGVLTLLNCILGSLDRLVEVSLTATPTISVSSAEGVVSQDILCDTQQLRLNPTLGAVSLVNSIDMAADVQLRNPLNGAPVGGPLNVLSVALDADAPSGGPVQSELFDNPDDFNETRRVGSHPMGLADFLQVAVTDVSLINGGVNLTSLLTPLLAPLASAVNLVLGELDEHLLTPVAERLGLSLGGADLTALTMTCDLKTPRLVG